jgi:branched-chain amino acid aminotransferase
LSTQRYINYDGKLYPENEKIFTINNRAFKYGDAVFETIRVINGQPVFVHDHFTRLKKGMDLLRMNTIPLTFEELYEQILHLIEKNKITEGARVRITVFRVGEGLYTPVNDTKSYVIEAIPISKNLYELNEEGLHIDLYTDIKVHPTILTQIKTTNKIPNVLTGIYKKEHDLDDCLMINEQHHIVEAISSNVFLYKNNTLYTPSISEGCIDGITRKHIIEVANSMNITVIEGAVTGSMLLQTDELFLTNSIAGIKWVKEYRGKFYTNETTKLILEKFNEVVS